MCATGIDHEGSIEPGVGTMTDATSRDDPAPFAEPSFLLDQARALVAFYLERSVDPGTGGFVAQIDDDGRVYDPHTRHLVHSCRYAHNFALGHRFGLLPGCREAAEHGLAFLREAHRDPVHGGYFWSLTDREPVDRRKFAYGHAFVLLAAATALRAGLDARDLLDDIEEVLEHRFWRSLDALYVDEASEDWTTVDPYRGQNANMHLVEALLAAFDATGAGRFLDRAALVARRVTLDLTAQTGGLLWEHYDAEWRADLAYNRATPRDLFRPYGVLSGHLLEWAKLLVLLDRARPTDWAVPTARRHFASATAHAWDERHGGFLYAFDLDGGIIDDAKYHWVIAEAIGAAAVLYAHTGDAAYLDWYERSWRHAWAHQIDHERGGWYTALTRDNRREELPFARGKGDFYHQVGACLLAREALGSWHP